MNRISFLNRGYAFKGLLAVSLVNVHASYCRIWLEIPKMCFLMTQLI